MVLLKVRPFIRAAFFTALTAIGAWLRLPLPSGAITLQFLFAIMAGVLLGAKYGAFSQLLYVALGLLGLPVFSSGGGFTYVLQPSFGFLLGLIAAAWVAGRVCRHSTSVRRIAVACSAALAALYCIGLPYMAWIMGSYAEQTLSFSQLLWVGLLSFLPGDAVKIALCCLLCPRIAARLGKMHEAVE